MDRGGLSGDDGPTHHGLFDISYLRGIPNMVHMDPKDEEEFANMLYTAMLHHGPIAIRYPRGAGMGVAPKAKLRQLAIGQSELIQTGEQIAIFSLGAMLPVALETAHQLEAEGFSVAVINARFAKPIDKQSVQYWARRAELLISFEDHVLSGGFGSALLEELNRLDLHIPLIRIGWPDQFIEHGKPEALRLKYGLSAHAAVERARPYLMSRQSKVMAVR